LFSNLSGISGVFTSNLSGANITGTAANFSVVTGVSGTFTNRVSGGTITGVTGLFATLTGVSGTFTSQVSGQNFAGENATFNYITGSTRVESPTISGAVVTGNVGRFANLTGVSGTFTSRISGAYITGTLVEAITVTAATGNFTVANFTQTTTGSVLVSGSGFFGNTLEGAILKTRQTLTGTTTYYVSSGTNGFSVGAVTLDSGATVDVASGSTWYVYDEESGVKLVVPVTGNTDGVKGALHVLFSGATITLPASPATGDYLSFVNRSNTITSVVDRNGSNIVGSGANLLIDDANAKFEMTYINATEGWTINLA
jgi:uncharacterized protein YjbI with pentapeptide repeats